MKVLVTGGAGFIGSHMCDLLIEESHDVVAIDNLSLGRDANIQHLMENDNFNFVKADVLNEELMTELFRDEKFDIVIHLAANSDIAQSHDNPNIDKDNTFKTTYIVLNKMKEFGVKKIIFASTSAIYGDTPEKLVENFGPLEPVSHYGASKLASEAFISSFTENYGFQSWIVRFPNVVGERATHGVIFDFINKLRADSSQLEVFGDGEQFKPYLYVKDLVKAIFYVWENSNDKYNVFNIGVDSRTKVKEIASMVIEEMGLKSTIKYTGGARGWIGDVPEFNYDLTKIQNLGWSASISSNDAVLKSIKHILRTDYF